MPSKVKSGAEFLRGIASGLRSAVNRPTVWGYKPHPKQEEFHHSPAKGRLFLGGNRSGKTVAGGVEIVRYARGEHPHRRIPMPARLRVIAVDFLNGVEKIVKPEIARWMPPSSLIGGSWEASYNKELRTLTLENGSFIEFMSYDQDLEKFAGTSRHGIWFDEEPPHDIFVENKARLIDVGGDWWITMTPVEGMTWVYDDIYIAARTDPLLDVIEVDMTQNPYLNEGEIQNFLTGLTMDERKARIHGKFVQIGGLIYKKFSPKNIMDPFTPSPEQYLHVASMDHGFNNPTAWLWAAVDTDGRIFVYDEHYEGGKIVSYHAQKVHLINQAHGFVPSYNVGDPSIKNVDPLTGTSVQQEYLDFGVPILPGNNDVRAGINRVARLLEGVDEKPQLYITRNCINLLHELQRYRWSTWATKKAQFDKNKKEEPQKKDDHAADALRYLVASRPLHDDGKVIPESTGPMGMPTAVSSSLERVDEGVSSLGQEKRYVDSVLGDDW